MYYLREHYSDVYFHYNYDVEKDNVQYFDYVGGSYDVSDGNEEEATAFINEMNAFLDNPANNFADDAVFDAFFSRYVDEQSFIDYFIIQSWCGNWDCVGNRNNHRLWRAGVARGGQRLYRRKAEVCAARSRHGHAKRPVVKRAVFQFVGRVGAVFVYVVQYVRAGHGKRGFQAAVLQ